MEEFAVWLEQERVRRRLSRKEAAARAGVSASNWNRVANQYGKPGLGFLQGVARAFHLRVEEVVERAGGVRVGEELETYQTETRLERFIEMWEQLDETDQELLLRFAQRLMMQELIVLTKE